MGEWLPISELFDFEKGSLQSSKCVPGSYNFITAAEEWKTHETFTHDCEALVFAMAASGSLGRTHYVKGKFIASDLCFILQPKKDKKLDLKFYYRVFNFLREDIVKKTATGTSKLAINQTNFGKYMLPYFDIEHQLKFSEKLDSISFIKNDLINRFDDQSKYLSQLRQSILQEAIEGKLTDDWRKQNPVRKGDPNTDAAALLEEIKLEKEKMIAEGKIKRKKPLEPIKPEEIPFELPEGWVWCRLGDICELITSGSRDWAQYYNSTGRAKFIRMGNLSHNWFDLKTDKIQMVEPPIDGEGTRTSLMENDLLISITGDVGWKGLIPSNFGEAYINQHTALIRFVSIIRGKYFPIILCSPFSYKQFNYPKRGIKNSFRLSDIQNHIVPFPFLSEQLVIIQRVEHLLFSVKQMEEQVNQRKRQAEELMQAILKETFEEGM